MKKLVLIMACLIGQLASAQLSVESYLGDFSAPPVYGRTNLTGVPDGTIVFDTSANAFYGKISGASASSNSGWVSLSNSATLGTFQRAVVTCSSSSSISSQSGSWVTSISNVSSGACTITLASGTFSSSPTCVISNNSATAPTSSGAISSLSNSSTQVTIAARDTSGGSLATSFSANLICVGN